MRTRQFPIGAISAKTGVNIETIRYYERIGIMPAPPRTEGGQRAYGEDHLKRLTFIHRCRALGFSLAEIRALLGIAGPHALTCAEVSKMAHAHIAGIRRKVRDLKKLDRVLSDLAARCHGENVPDCPILDALSSGQVSARGRDTRGAPFP